MADDLAKPAPEEICGNCKYYKPVSTSDLSNGTCLRYPPEIINDTLEAVTEDKNFIMMRPKVDEEDTCGEYRAKGPTELGLNSPA